jgi:hypothetical protein
VWWLQLPKAAVNMHLVGSSRRWMNGYWLAEAVRMVAAAAAALYFMPLGGCTLLQMCAQAKHHVPRVWVCTAMHAQV